MFREEEALFLAELAAEEERLFQEMMEEDARLRAEEAAAAAAEDAMIAAEEEVWISTKLRNGNMLLCTAVAKVGGGAPRSRRVCTGRS